MSPWTSRCAPFTRSRACGLTHGLPTFTGWRACRNPILENGKIPSNRPSEPDRSRQTASAVEPARSGTTDTKQPRDLLDREQQRLKTVVRRRRLKMAACKSHWSNCSQNGEQLRRKKAGEFIGDRTRDKNGNRNVDNLEGCSSGRHSERKERDWRPFARSRMSRVAPCQGQHCEAGQL